MQHWVSKFLFPETPQTTLSHSRNYLKREKADMQSLVDAGDEKSLEEELQSCRHFLVDSEIQKGKYSVFNLVVNNLTAQVIEEKLDRVLDSLKCAAKLNVALGFILQIIEDGKFRYFYAHENNTLLKQSKLVSNKDDMAKLKEILKKSDFIESCTKESSNTKWRFFKLKNLTIFAALLRDIPMGCKDVVLPDLNLFWKIIQSIALLMNRTPKNQTETIFASSEHLLCTCSPLALHKEMIRDSKKKHESYSISFLLTVLTLTLESSKEFAWLIFHLWKI